MSAIDRPLALRARQDIQTVESAFVGQAAYVLKDLLTLELFHLTAEEFFLFQAVQVRTTLSRLRREFERRFAPRRITELAIQEGLNQLHKRGLLLSDAPAQGKELLERSRERQKQEWLQSFVSLLSFRLGSFDATGLIDGLYPCIRWAFSLPCLLVAAATMLYALRILFVEFGELTATLPAMAELAQPKYWAMWLVSVIVVKVFHELGHALACKHFGGRCHEIGVILLAFVPCLYCDVSDVWRMPNKWHRIAVSAAGMAVELLIASLALIAWSYAEPGIFQLWCLSLVLICSVTTLFVNANPLLRYDGYYILSDLVEVPNLATRAQSLVGQRLTGWLQNQPPQQDPLLSPVRRRAVTLYAIAAKVYLTLIVLLIFAGLIAVTKPYRLENLVYTLAALTLCGMLIAPLMSVWRLWKNPVLRYRLRIPRALLLMVLVGLLGAGVFLFPIEQSLTGPAVFIPQQAQAIYAATGGQLVFSQPAGTIVEKGEVIARLADTEIDLAVAKHEGEFLVRQVSYKQIETMRSWDETASARAPTARAALADAEAQLAEQRQRQEELTLRAPAAGVIVAPPAIEPEANSQGQLRSWIGSPLEPRNRGCWIEPGTIICSVGDSQDLNALVAIEEADAPGVSPGMQVRILVESSPVRVVEGIVVDIAKRGSTRSSAASTGDRTKEHLVEVRLTTEDRLLMIGSRGTAKIEASRRTLWQIAYHEVQEMLKLPW